MSIDSIHDFSPQALGELKQWLEPFFGTTGGIGSASAGGALDVMGITAPGGDTISDSAYGPIGFPASYDFNTNSVIWPTRGGSGSGVGQEKTGLYEITGWADIDPGAGNQRILRLRINGTTLVGGGWERDVPNTADPNDMLTTAIVQLTANDYVELLVFQDSGGDLTVNAAWMQWKYLHS